MLLPSPLLKENLMSKCDYIETTIIINGWLVVNILSTLDYSLAIINTLVIYAATFPLILKCGQSFVMFYKPLKPQIPKNSMMAITFL